MWRKTIPLLALAALASPRTYAGDELLKEGDQKKLGKEVAAFWQALADSKGISEAFAQISEDVAKYEKKLKGKSLLASPTDWERVFFFAKLESYDDKLKKGKVEAIEADFGGTPIEYAMYVSSKYRSKDGPFPLVLSIGPLGTDPETHLSSTWSDPAKDASILFAPSIPADKSLLGELGSQDNPGGIMHAMVTFGKALEATAVDMNRVFLVGHGEGGDVALETAAGYPHLFAGVIVVGEPTQDHDATNFQHVPVLFVGGGARASAFEAQAKGLGFASVSRMDSAAEPDLWAWMGDKARVAYPMEVVFSPRKVNMASSNWLKVEGIDLDQSPMVRAKVDRDANTISIDADGISSVIVYFNDVLVDMSNPVKVVVNGNVNEASLQRNQRAMLELGFKQGDWGRVFTAVQPYDVPSRQ